MFYRLFFGLMLLFPLSAAAVYFPGGIDWTNPSQASFVQSLYLNVLGRAPSQSESQTQVQTLRRNDNRTARLRTFESLLETSEYRRTFQQRGDWQIYRAPDYNYNNGSGSWRYQAASSTPQGFANLPGGSRLFSENIARSVANYYNAFCYQGDPCIDNPELARDRGVTSSNRSSVAHACADPSNLTSQFKWVAVNGTTYPQGIGSDLVCMQDYFYQADQLKLQRYDCDSGYVNCKRNAQLDLRATRSGSDNDGNNSLFFRDGSRLALISNAGSSSTNNTGAVIANSDAELLGTSHECADTTKTTSRFLWKGPNTSAVSNGVGSAVVCMDNYYYKVQRLTLKRFDCQRGFTDCRENPQEDLNAESRTRVDGNPALKFANGTTLSLTRRGNSQTAPTTERNRRTVPTQPTTRESTNATRPLGNTTTNNQSGRYRGTDCANPTARVSQFRWKSDGLSSWPDGVDGTFICLNNAYYEITQNTLRHYTCQSNYRSCRANPGKDLNITQISADGTVRTLSNGDQVTLVSR